jgi:hypothetical protein
MTDVRVLKSGLGVLFVTTVHHVYGAIRYDTPWRHHAAMVAGITAAAMLVAYAFRRERAARWAFLGITLLVPILGFGAVEGFYNHVLKNAVYFGGGSPELMATLFPPPAYELPNDTFFELSGMLHVPPAAMAAWYMGKLMPMKSRVSSA